MPTRRSMSGSRPAQLEPRLGQLEILRPRDLEVGGLALDDAHAPAGRLDQRGVVGGDAVSLDMAPLQPSHHPAKRCPGPPASGARHGFPGPPATVAWTGGAFCSASRLHV